MKKHWVAWATWGAMALPAVAGVSAQEAALLGKTLTPMGAIKASNADGNIPAYTGGMTKPPAGWTRGSRWIDPYESEKPILRIDATNVTQHAGKLADGMVALLKTMPGFYINVFKTHRDYAYPKFVADGTVRNASNPDCKTEDDGLTLSKGCRGGYPFPIPKTGYEVMWNKLINYQPVVHANSSNVLIDSNGNPVLVSTFDVYSDNLNYFEGSEARTNTDAISNQFAMVTDPPRMNGMAQGRMDFLNPIKFPGRTWLYTPGLRRVSMAPEFAYDTPHTLLGGSIMHDEMLLFVGAMDRFDFKLKGRKEAYIPANNYPLTMGSGGDKCRIPKLLLKTHMNPECVRFELRRVWEVEATVKNGKRHMFSTRRWQIDEDSYGVGTYEAWDQTGKLARIGLGFSAQVYDPEQLGVYKNSFLIHDLNKRAYIFSGYPNKPPVFGGPMKEIDTKPESIAGKSVR